MGADMVTPTDAMPDETNVETLTVEPPPRVNDNPKTFRDDEFYKPFSNRMLSQTYLVGTKAIYLADEEHGHYEYYDRSLPNLWLHNQSLDDHIFRVGKDQGYSVFVDQSPQIIRKDQCVVEVFDDQNVYVAIHTDITETTMRLKVLNAAVEYIKTLPKKSIIDYDK
jgi:hypothetical protein